MTEAYKGFIPENCAPPGCSSIGLYDEKGIRRGGIRVPARMRAPKGKRLYSFGVVSDVHTYATASYAGDTTANDDFAKALAYYSDLYNKGTLDFLAICGDLTCYGNSLRQQNEPRTDLDRYLSLVSAPGVTVPIYAMAGNHEWWGSAVDDATMERYTGHPLSYSFPYRNDLFIMCGMASASYAFTDDSVAWLKSVLEENRNRRCFLFCHGPALGFSGDPTGIYPFDILGNAAGATFLDLLGHYTNTVYFHGHSHILYASQDFTQNHSPQIPNCIYDDHLGVHSVHIPSLAIPIDIASGSRVVVPGESQGYVVDVYENEILLRGRDFVKDQFVPTAQYKLDTTLKSIDANTI